MPRGQDAGWGVDDYDNGADYDDEEGGGGCGDDGVGYVDNGGLGGGREEEGAADAVAAEAQAKLLQVSVDLPLPTLQMF